LILVVVVLMAFLGFRNSLFVAVAIPLSMLLSFIVIQLMGYTLNMVVLFSLILVLGMLVDNAVVIVENIYRHRELGSDGPTAALEATKEVAVPVIASTITTLCAFAPLLLWPGIIGDFMSYLPVTLIIGLTASLVVALVFNPTLCAYFMKPPAEGQKRSQDEGAILQRYRRLLRWALESGADHGTRGWFWRNWSLLVAFVACFSGGVGLILVAFFLEGRVPVLFTLSGALMGLGGAAFALQGLLWIVWSLLRRLLGWTPYVTDRRAGVIYSMGVILALTMFAYSFLGQGVELFPEMDPRQIFVDVEAPSGATLETSNDLVDRIEGLTTETKDRRYTLANVGSSGMSLEDIGGGSSVSNKSRVTLDLLDRIEREQKNTLTTMEEIRKSVGDVEGAEIKVNKPNHGPPTGKPVSIRVSGDDFHVLERLSREVRERIRSVPGLVNLDDDLNQGKPEIRVKVDRVEAALTGVHTRDIANTIQTAVRGSDVSEYRIGEDEYDIVVRLDPEYRATLEDLTDLTVPDEDGLPIPIRAVASLEPGLGPSSIRRVDLRRVVTIEGDVVRARGRTEDSVRQEVAGRLELIEWPEGYRWEFAGSNQDEEETTAFVERAFVIAVMLIMLVLVTQFDSLILPMTIMVSVVLSLIGVLWGLILTQTAFGIIMTGIGVISLAGVVVNNAIVLCDFIRQLRERGFDKTKAVIEAGVIRLRPVFLTAVTTVLGLIPLTIGLNIDFFKGVVQTGVESSQWWGPMGVAVIFGLTVATVLTLVVVPVTYHSLDDMTEAMQAMATRFRSGRPREEVTEETEGATSLRSTGATTDIS
jgi:multidrug efflux pump subunit AcrB